MLRFYLDDDSSSRLLARLLEQAGIEVVTSLGMGMRSADDESHLMAATQRSMVLYSANRADFMRIHRDWMLAGRHHAGIVLVAQRRYSEAEQARRLFALATEFEPADMQDRLEFLSRWPQGPAPTS